MSVLMAGLARLTGCRNSTGERERYGWRRLPPPGVAHPVTPALCWEGFPRSLEVEYPNLGYLRRGA
jgi:hypothetical protein